MVEKWQIDISQSARVTSDAMQISKRSSEVNAKKKRVSIGQLQGSLTADLKCVDDILYQLSSTFAKQVTLPISA